MTDTDKTDELTDIFLDASDGQTTFTDEQDEQAKQGAIESEGDHASDALPATNSVTCDECGHGEAKWYTQQIRAADESETRFFICTDCGNRWREDDN